MTNAGTAGFDFRNTGATFGASIVVGAAGNPNFYANWQASTNAQDDITKPSWGLRLDVANDKLRILRAPAGGSLTDVVNILPEGFVGIGTTAPMMDLEVNGGVRLNSADPQPACNANARGTFWVVQSPSGDTVQVCIFSGGGFVWRTLAN